MVLLWQKGGVGAELFHPEQGAKIRVFETEQKMLGAWLLLLREYDPDALVAFQVRYSSR